MAWIVFLYRFKWCKDRWPSLKSRRQWDSEETRGAVQLYGDAVWSCPCCNPHTSGCGTGFWDFPVSPIAMLCSFVRLSECGVPHIAGNYPKNNYFLWWSNRHVELYIYMNTWWKLWRCEMCYLTVFSTNVIGARCWGTQCIKDVYRYRPGNCTFALLVIHVLYEGHLESKERFAIKKYLLIIGKKKNMQVLSHTFSYFST